MPWRAGGRRDILTSKISRRHHGADAGPHRPHRPLTALTALTKRSVRPSTGNRLEVGQGQTRRKPLSDPCALSRAWPRGACDRAERALRRPAFVAARERSRNPGPGSPASRRASASARRSAAWRGKRGRRLRSCPAGSIQSTISGACCRHLYGLRISNNDRIQADFLRF